MHTLRGYDKQPIASLEFALPKQTDNSCHSRLGHSNALTENRSPRSVCCADHFFLPSHGYFSVSENSLCRAIIAGPSATTKIIGKMKRTKGISSLTPALAATSSAACVRRVRSVSENCPSAFAMGVPKRSEEHTSELQSRLHLVCRLLLEKKKTNNYQVYYSLLRT